jgi:hypothetical protein
MKAYITLFTLFFFIISNSYSQVDPVAVNDTAYLMQYGTININVLANDYDPNYEAIHIYDLDDADGFMITYADSVVTIAMLDYFNWDKLSIRYRIRNESGENDRADIIVFIEENPDVPIAVKDIIQVKSQTEIIVDLLANDEYSGIEDLAIDTILPVYHGTTEIMEDGHHIKFISDAFSGAAILRYRIVELGGNEYKSGFVDNTIYITRNPDEPIAVADTFSINEGETILLDVLANDIPSSKIELDWVYSYNEIASIVGNKIQIIPPENYYGEYTIHYRILKTDNGLKSAYVMVKLNIMPDDNWPIAVNDTIEFVYQDSAYCINPLINDLNPSGGELVLAGSHDTVINFGNHIIMGNGYYQFPYRCRDTLLGRNSESADIIIHVLPPDSIQMMDQEVTYRIGDTLSLNAFDFTNLSTSTEFSAQSNLGIIEIEGQSINYTYDLLSLDNMYNYFYYDRNILRDTIIIRYSSNTDPFPDRHTAYVYVNYTREDAYSLLQANNFTITISPQGIIYNGVEIPQESSLSVFSLMQTWIADYSGAENMKISGDLYYSDGFDFFTGPIADNYSEDYTEKYYRTWKISKQEIEDHKVFYNKPAYEMPDAILNWPADKVAYDGQLYDGADFIDIDNDGEYHPENGDYPRIKGDEAVLYIVNDGRFSNTSYGNGDSLNIDIYALVYAFDRPSNEIFNNTFFINYKVINKSGQNYEDFKFGQMTALDDQYTKGFSASDSAKNTYYYYWNFSPDLDWNKLPPVRCVSFLNKKMDKFTDIASGFLYENKKYHYMNGTWPDSITGFQDPQWSNYAPLNYVYPSNPADPYGWSQINNYYYSSGLGKSIGTSGSNYFGAGESLEYELAFHFSYTPDSGYFESIDHALNNVSQLIECYQNDSIPGGGSFTQIPKEPTASVSPVAQIYPNPAHTALHIQTDYKDFKHYRIYSIYGQLVEERKFSKQIDIEYLQDGLYLIQFLNRSGDALLTQKFVKQ